MVEFWQDQKVGLPAFVWPPLHGWIVAQERGVWRLVVETGNAFSH